MILAGRPSHGQDRARRHHRRQRRATQKAAAARRRAAEAATNYTVGVFSLEMSAEQLAMRLLSAEAQIPLRRAAPRQAQAKPTGSRSSQASQALGSAADVHRRHAGALGGGAAHPGAAAEAHATACRLLVVDYLQLMRGSSANSQTNRVQEISEITQGLKAIAKELNVPVLALSQLSPRGRAARGQAPAAVGPARIRLDRAGRRRGHVRLSRGVLPGAVGAAAARGRERRTSSSNATSDWHERCDRCHNQADVIIAKQRNGPIGTVQAAVRRRASAASAISRPRDIAGG